MKLQHNEVAAGEQQYAVVFNIEFEFRIQTLHRIVVSQHTYMYKKSLYVVL